MASAHSTSSDLICMALRRGAQTMDGDGIAHGMIAGELVGSTGS